MTRRCAATATAAVLLHAVLAAPRPWEFAGLLTWLWPTVDCCAILAFAVACGFSVRLRGAAARLAAGLVFVAMAARTAVTMMPAFYEVPFRGADLMKLPAVWFLFTHDRPGGAIAQDIAVIVLSLLLTWFLVSWSCRTLLARWNDAPARWRWAWVTALGGAAAAGELLPLPLLQPSYLRPFATACWNSLTGSNGGRGSAGHWRFAVEQAQAAFDSAGPPTALEGADVHVLFIESYGREGWRDPDTGAGLRSFWRDAGERMAAAGWYGASAWWAPAVQGGGSHIAHMELLTGVRVASEEQFEAVLEHAQRPLPARLRTLGYHTVNAQPAMYVEWPAGQRFYGFDENVFQAAFGYSGYRYHWGLIPDQFALHHLLEHVVRPATAPLFVQYVSVSSHAPFTTVPPYEPDWSKVDNERFQGEPAQKFDLTFLNFAGNPATPVAYAATLQYSLRTAVDYALLLERPSLVLILGDHQPPAAGVARQHDTTPDVPMHALANRPGLIDRLLVQGFARGCMPPETAPVRPLCEFAALFLRAFALPRPVSAGR